MNMGHQQFNVWLIGKNCAFQKVIKKLNGKNTPMIIFTIKN